MIDEINEDVNKSSVDSSAAENETNVEGLEPEAKRAGVPVENRLAELNRKTDKRFSSLEGKIDQLINFVEQSQQGLYSGADKASNYSSESGATLDPATVAKAEVESLRSEMLREKQAASFMEACELFPELDQKSSSYDEDFYKAVDQEFRKLSITKDPKAPLRAAQIIAIERGKIDALARSRVFQDESRRSRMLGEGGMQPSKTKKAFEELPQNLAALSRILNVDQKGLKDHMKKNAAKYGMKD